MSARLIARFGEQAVRPRLIHHFPDCGSWSVTPYEHCDLRCTYCITHAQGTSVPRFVEPELTERLAVELAEVGPDAILSLGAVCDAYPRAEAVHGVTRTVLSQLVGGPWRLVIITKGATILRDIDLLQQHPNVSVEVSLCSVDEAALRHVDPLAPTAAERLGMVDTLAAAGVRVAVSAMPWIPGVTDATVLIERIPRSVPMHFAPLNVRKVADTPFGRRFDQAAVNEAYLREIRRVGPDRNVYWLPPVPLTDQESRPFALINIRVVDGDDGKLTWESVGIR